MSNEIAKTLKSVGIFVTAARSISVTSFKLSPSGQRRALTVSMAVASRVDETYNDLSIISLSSDLHKINSHADSLSVSQTIVDPLRSKDPGVALAAQDSSDAQSKNSFR